MIGESLGVWVTRMGLVELYGLSDEHGYMIQLTDVTGVQVAQIQVEDDDEADEIIEHLINDQFE